MPAIRSAPYGFVALLTAVVACDEATIKRAVDAGSGAGRSNMTIRVSAQTSVIHTKNGEGLAGAGMTTDAGHSAKGDAQGEFKLTLTDKVRHVTVTRDSLAAKERARSKTRGSLTVYLNAVDEGVVLGRMLPCATYAAGEVPHVALGSAYDLAFGWFVVSILVL